MKKFFSRTISGAVLLLAAGVFTPQANAAEGDILGNQIKKRVPISATAKRWALIKLPDDFDANPGKKYPLLIFCHGAGEANSGDVEAEVSNLMKYGPPLFVSQGHKMEFTNPRNGQLYKFIVVSPQAQGAATFLPTQIKYIYDSEPLIRDRIARDAIFLTGLSRGGRAAMLPFAVQFESILHEFTALAPMSPYRDGETYTWAKGRELKTPVWTFCGVKDSDTFKNATQALIDSLNSVNPGQVRATWYPYGHSNWNNYYNPNYRESFDGVNMNLYEWFLSKIALPEPLKLTAAVSRKIHAFAGALDLDLPLTGGGIEPRIEDTCTLVFTFDRDIADGEVSVKTGQAALVSAPVFSGNTMTVVLNQVNDRQTLTLTLAGVEAEDDGGTYSGDFSFSVLIGDVDGNGVVTMSDRLAAQGKLGQPASASVLREDINLSGGISSADVLQIQQHIGKTIEP